MRKTKKEVVSREKERENTGFATSLDEMTALVSIDLLDCMLDNFLQKLGRIDLKYKEGQYEARKTILLSRENIPFM